MGQAAPRRHPAVVPRSQYTLVRALLAIATVAVAGLSVVVVILAEDGDQVSSTRAAKPIESIRYGDFNPATGRPESARVVPTPPPTSRPKTAAGDGTSSSAPKDPSKNSANRDAAPSGGKASEFGTSQDRRAQP